MKRKKGKDPNFFEKFAGKATKATGSTAAIISSFALIIIWALTGPFFHYSEIWQLIINTGTTIITFLMVFLIQKSQNKDSMAVHLKLNELLATSYFSSNTLVDVEDLSEEELEVLRKYYLKLKQKAKNIEREDPAPDIQETKTPPRKKRVRSSLKAKK